MYRLFQKTRFLALMSLPESMHAAGRLMFIAGCRVDRRNPAGLAVARPGLITGEKSPLRSKSHFAAQSVKWPVFAS
jgi:hypothetical protein